MRCGPGLVIRNRFLYNESMDRISLRLFHASLSAFDEIDVSAGNPRSDFGPGFYTTTNWDQSLDWGKKKAERFNQKGFYVHVFDFDVKYPILSKHFDKPDYEWLDTIADCRTYGTRLPFDIVSGPVADDSVFPTIQNYIQQRKLPLADFELRKLKNDTITRLRIESLFDQYVVISEKLIPALKRIHIVTCNRSGRPLSGQWTPSRDNGKGGLHL